MKDRRCVARSSRTYNKDTPSTVCRDTDHARRLLNETDSTCTCSAMKQWSGSLASMLRDTDVPEDLNRFTE